MACNKALQNKLPFDSRFCAEIRRENYPTDRAAALHGVTGQWTQPAHTITLLPALLLVNLLPVDLNYSLVGVLGRIQPGCEAPITYVRQFQCSYSHFSLSQDCVYILKDMLTVFCK